MLTEYRLHEKREQKRLNRLDVLKEKQARVARLVRHNYGSFKYAVKTLEQKQSMLTTLMLFASKVKSMLRWNK